MNNGSAGQDSFRALQLMTELEAGEQLSQREIACRLGVAVGLVNSYLKNFVAKGWVRVKNYPRNRYAYLLTPKGFAEKSRLAYQHFNYFTGLYTTTRSGFYSLFMTLRERGATGVAFCGVDEVAEIAYLSLQEVGMTLITVYDSEPEERTFLNYEVLPLTDIQEIACPLIITTLKRKQQVRSMLSSIGIQEESIYRVD